MITLANSWPTPLLSLSGQIDAVDQIKGQLLRKLSSGQQHSSQCQRQDSVQICMAICMHPPRREIRIVSQILILAALFGLLKIYSHEKLDESIFQREQSMRFLPSHCVDLKSTDFCALLESIIILNID